MYDDDTSGKRRSRSALKTDFRPPTADPLAKQVIGLPMRLPRAALALMAAALALAVQLASARSQARTDPALAEAFKAWIAAHNISMENIDWPVQTVNGRAAVAARFISPGEFVCSVPPFLMMTTLLFDVNPKLRGLKPLPWRKETPHDKSYVQRIKLALVLLNEIQLGPSSRWKPWIDILPSEPFPMFSPSELDEFQDPDLVKSLRHRDDEMANEFNTVQRAIKMSPFSFGNLSREHWIWARQIVDSRAYSLPADESRRLDTLGFVPLCDLFNYDAKNEWDTVFSDIRPPVPDPWLVSIHSSNAPRVPVQKGMEIFSGHMENNNFFFLVVLGFIVRDNPKDSIRVAGRDLPKILSDKALYEWCTEDEEDFPVMQVLQECKDDMENAIKTMPTSLEQDLELLQKDSSSIPLIYRVGRKQLLTKHMQSMDRIISKLSILLEGASANSVPDLQLL